ncbi:MAG: YHS domain-containing (seleno)protein [Pseudomonadota bacterium]
MTNKHTFTRRSVLITGAAIALTATPAFALPRIATGRFSNLAIKGYDTTSYFQHGEARKGASSTEINYQGATWRFASEDDANIFKADPAAYAPQFGGYCTRALSLEKTVPGNPQVWRIYEDNLYLFVRPVGGTKFDEDPAAMLALASAYWNTLELTN